MVGFRLLTIWFIIDHGRRRIIHFNVATKPTEQWVIQQLREPFPYGSAPRYLIYDNDSIFSDKVTEAIKYIGTESKRAAYRSPWQNGTAQRWVGSARRGRSRTSLCFAAPAHLTAMDGGNAGGLQEQSLPCAMSCWIT